MGNCYIVGAGDFDGQGFAPGAEDFVIAADGGYGHLAARGLPADLVVGDFDSSPAPDHPHVLRFPPEKDDTDLLLAVRLGLERGHRRFFLFGGTGGARLDHTLANLQVLGFLRDRDAEGYLIGGGQVCAWLRDETLLFPAGYAGYFSIFAAGEAIASLTLRGLKYPLEGYRLTHTLPRGVSNEFLPGTPAEVCVQGGDALALWELQARSMPGRKQQAKEPLQ